MKSPFITLTRTRDSKTIQININHIVSFQDQTYSKLSYSKDKSRHCTYILVNNTAHASFHVKESYDQVASLINAFYTQNA